MNAPNNFSFSVALERLKNGGCVARNGWNGKGMYLFKVTDYSIEAQATPSTDVIIAKGDDQNESLPFIAMRTADSKFVPWLCSQTDMLADDWEIVHGS